MQNSHLRIFSAGSFRYALADLMANLDTLGMQISTEFGPAGILRERIEQGETCDIFISANTAHIKTLSQYLQIVEQKTIAHNQLALTLRNLPEYQAYSSVEILLNKRLKIGSSTPIFDPSGDYTWQLFDVIEQHFPCEGKRLKQQTKQLVGGKTTPQIPADILPSRYFIETGVVDVFIGYAHYGQRVGTGFCQKLFAPPFQMIAQYGAARLTNNEAAQYFFSQLSQPKAQQIIRANGFI